MYLLEERSRLQKCNGVALSRFPTLPLIASRSALCKPFAVDVELPANLQPLTAEHQDMLRAAMSRVLSRETAKRVYRDWQEEWAKPTVYRKSGFAVWQKALASFMLVELFPNGSLQYRALAAQQDTQNQLEARQLERMECLRRAYAYVTNPESYMDRIIDRPSTKVKAEEALSDAAFAFRFEPAKGEQKGQRFLAFNKVSLLRLLKSQGVGEDLYEAFLDLCDQGGILDSRDRAINLDGKTFHVITFRQ